jgi:hypothetical protein
MTSFMPVLTSNLELDPENPRLPERLKTKDTTEKDVLNWMLEDATLIDLMASIAENGFFPGEPIIVIKNTSNKNYIVIEGNRRLAAVKLLQDPSLAGVSTKSVHEISNIAFQNKHVPIDLMVFVAISRDSVDNYLGFRHVTGVKQWPTISKARYLYRLFKSRPYFDGIFKELAREIGSKGVYVRRLIYGYELFLKIKGKNYYGLDLEEESFDLSLITDAAVNYSAIADYMGFDTKTIDPVQSLSDDKFEEVVKWLYKTDQSGKTKVGETRNLRVLNKVLQSPRAKKIFIEEDKSLFEAAQYTDLMDESIRTFLKNAYNNIVEAQKQVHLSENPTSEDIQLCDDIIASSELIQSRLRRTLRLKQNADV